MSPHSLQNIKAIVTAGPTREYLDPIRYLSNSSSGKQGYAIADALARHGAVVKLLSGPVSLASLPDVTTIDTETAQDMQRELNLNLPADIVICAAAVADFRPENISKQKIKKQPGVDEYQLSLVKNPDLLKNIASMSVGRPKLVIGFAAETENLIVNAKKKLLEKKCDWILANDVSIENKVIGYDHNKIIFMTRDQTEYWDYASKEKIAEDLVSRIIEYFQ